MIQIFEKYKLRGNPFEEYSLKYEMVGREKEWEEITTKLNFAFRGKKCRFIILEGDYGVGKTFTLQKLYTTLKEKPDLVVTKPTKFLAEKPIAAVPAEPKAKFGVYVINEIFRNLGLEELLKVLNKIDLNNRSLTISENSRNFFVAIKEKHKEAFDALTGDIIDTRKLKSLNIMPIKDPDDALRCLYDFQRILKKANIENFLIMLDEFEYIFSILGDVKITQILQTFRKIFDYYNYEEDMAKMVFIFAISPGGYERLKELEALRIKRAGGGGIAPFMRRISPGDRITLGPLTEDATRKMVIDRLDKERTEKATDKLYPLTDDCVRLVYEVGKGVPATILMYLSILLEDASEKGLRKVTAKETKSTFKNLGIITK